MRESEQDIQTKYNYDRAKYVKEVKLQEYRTMKFSDWQKIKASLEEKYDRENKEEKLAYLRKNHTSTPLLNDLPDTIKDA